MAGAGGRARADRVHAELLAELAAAVGRSLMPRTSASRLASTSANSSLERLRELLHALALERLDDVVVVDPGRGERLEHAARAVDVLARACRATSPWSWNASTVSRGIVLTVSRPISSST